MDFSNTVFVGVGAPWQRSREHLEDVGTRFRTCMGWGAWRVDKVVSE